MGPAAVAILGNPTPRGKLDFRQQNPAGGQHRVGKPEAASALAGDDDPEWQAENPVAQCGSDPALDDRPRARRQPWRH